ncbi:MAG TPA: tartrate dehydrogenase [Bacillus sp. (in: firmicutes)]|uniref:tartrate dehydrogenase n=1 Tax=Bacillus litorisediminis TaxID=2922713 RepID=UPI001FAFDC67|nr:tartrate dehydrogenase [Bacillus litorisediminis]HWO75619.1 tartrate dehydrogenase [Bacillus sp. (in: firmicutes)]
MREWKIAVLPGDGIGPEVMNEALKVLRTVKELDSTFSYHADLFSWNSEYYLKHGRMMPENGLEILKGYDAILFGAIGDQRVADDVSVWELIMPIRKSFQQYVNFRPVKQLPGIKTPYTSLEKPIDFVIMRENAEGEYSNSGGTLYGGTEDELAVQNTILTRRGISRIGRYAFEYAQKMGKEKVTSATKSNAITHSMKLWDQVMEEVANGFPEIGYEKVFIDALAAYFVQRPHTFEVVVASNLFGDILSDLGSALVGGLGVSPSANINPEGNFPSMFEPVHGSAPDIAGTGKANPIAQIWSTALMLEHLGRKDLSDVIMAAIYKVLDDDTVKTADLGGTALTTEMGDAIIKELYELSLIG